MNSDKRQVVGYLIVVLCATALLLGVYQHDRGLWSSHEGRAGQIARNMMDSGDYLNQTLHYNRPSHQKPPLYYWAVCVAARLRGEVDQLAVRMPAMACAAATVLIVFAVGTHFASAQVGLVSALVLVTSMRFWWQGHVARIDILLTVLVIAAGLLFYSGYLNTRRRSVYYLLAYVLTAAGVLAKGPVAVALAGCGFGLFVLFERKWSEAAAAVLAWTLLAASIAAGRWWSTTAVVIAGVATALLLLLAARTRWPALTVHVLGVCVFAAVTLPYFVTIDRATDGAFTTEFFLRHNLDRATGQSGDNRPNFENHPFYLFLPYLFVGMLPWSWFLVGALVHALRRDHLYSRLRRYLVLWSGSMLVLLSLSSFKRADYMAPLYPLLALLIGCFVVSCCQPNKHNHARQATVVTGMGFAVVALLLVVIGGLSLFGQPITHLLTNAGESPLFSRYFNTRDAHDVVTLAPIFDERAGTVMMVGLLMAVGAAIVVVRNQSKRIWTTIGIPTAMMTIVLLGFTQVIAPQREPLMSHAPFADQIAPFVKGKDLAIQCTAAFQILFYLDRHAERLDSDHDLIETLNRPDSANTCFILHRKCLERIAERLPAHVRIAAQTVEHHFQPHVLLVCERERDTQTY